MLLQRGTELVDVAARDGTEAAEVEACSHDYDAADERLPVVAWCNAENDEGGANGDKRVEGDDMIAQLSSGIEPSDCGSASDTECTGEWLGALFEPVALAAAAISFLRTKVTA